MKPCFACKRDLPESEYYKGKEGGGYQTYCKDCQRKRQREWYQRKRQGRAFPPKQQQVCTVCQVEKPASEFYRHGGRPSGLSPACKPCWKRQMRSQKYGLTLEEQDALPRACQICGRKKPLVVDHDHSTGAVRGILCQPCNAALGVFKDDPVMVAKALEYLS